MISNKKYNKLAEKAETGTLSNTDKITIIRVETVPADPFPPRKQLFGQKKLRGVAKADGETRETPAFCPGDAYQNIYELLQKYVQLHGTPTCRKNSRPLSAITG